MIIPRNFHINDFSNEVVIKFIENFTTGADFISFALTQKRYLTLVEEVFNRLGKDLAHNDAFRKHIRDYYEKKGVSTNVVFRHQVITFSKQAQFYAYKKAPSNLSH
jgi:hypothetical protein